MKNISLDLVTISNHGTRSDCACSSSPVTIRCKDCPLRTVFCGSAPAARSRYGGDSFFRIAEIIQSKPIISMWGWVF